MRILTFTTIYPNNIHRNNGIFNFERVRALSKSNEVKVVAPIPFFPPIKLKRRWFDFSRVSKNEKIDGIDVYHPRYLLIPKIGMALYGISLFLSSLFVLLKIRKRFPFDIIDSHYMYPDGFAAVLLGRAFHKPVVVTAHGTDLNLYPKFPIIRFFLRAVIKQSDSVITVCEALKSKICEIEKNVPENKIKVIPNGVDISKFVNRSQQEAREKLNLPKNSKIVISIGALIRRKGYNYLVAAIHELYKNSKNHDILTIIIGEGNCRREIERLILKYGLMNKIKLVGFIPHNDLSWWLCASDIFCLTSSREGWPTVFFEAFACGKPVIATKVWGAPEVVKSS